MTKDNVSKDKLLSITHKMASKDDNAGQYARTGSTPSRVTRLSDKDRQYKDVNPSIVSDASESLGKHGEIHESKVHVSRIIDDEKAHNTTASSKPSDNFLNEEIAYSILEEILSKMEDMDKISRASSHYFLKHTSSHFMTMHTMGPMDKPLMRSDFNKDRKYKRKSLNRNRQLSSIVKELDFPINISKSKPVESRPRFERLILDTHVETSATITSTDGDGRCLSELGTKVEDSPSIDSPFNLCWCFGFNAEVPVINLSNEHASQILFANSQFAVIYDFHEETMSFLQGHLNTVTCMAADQKRRLLATADSAGDAGNSRVIVWDRKPCVLQVLDNVHPHGCQQIGFSTNGEYLITISAYETPISIKLWEFQKDTKNPSASTTVKESLGNVKKLTAHPNSRNEFAVTFERSVMFARVAWNTVFVDTSLVEGKVSDRIKDCEFVVSAFTPHKLGALTDTKFIEDSVSVAISSTCKGYVVVWEDITNSKHKRTYRKYVRLHLDSITNIEVIDEKIAVATDSGNVSFYDLELKILFFHKLHQEPLVSLSFNLSSFHSCITNCDVHSSCANLWRKEPRKLVDASLHSKPFSTRHYVVSTESGRIAYVNASSGIPKYLSFPTKEVFTALDILPSSQYLCAGTASGKCILFDTDLRLIKVSKQIKVQANLCQAISYLKYSPSRHVLACGMYTGDLWLLDPLLLIPVMDYPLTDCTCCITEIVFTPDSEYLIVTDVSHCISAYYLGEKPKLLGQYIAHYKTIVTITVGDKCSVETSRVTNSYKEIKIYTVSRDRSICLFVINREKKSFEFVLNQRVEQIALPMYNIHYSYNDTHLHLGVNSDYKFRLHDPLTSSVQQTVIKRCRGTFQAPDFGSPINYMESFENDGRSYLFFKTTNHIGIHLMPIDGNPFRALGFRASPTDITIAKIDPSGRYVFTISESLSGISMWEVNTRAVEDFYRSGGEGLEPFLKTLGWEQEQRIREFFDLGQFLHQGEGPSLVRTLKNSLPICEVANVLQALGCLLTKQDISELTNAWIVSAENSNYNLEYDEFVRLFINYRNRDLKLEELRQAFRDLVTGEPGSDAGDDLECDSETFMQKLLEKGEEITLEELYMDFSILTGGRSVPLEIEHLTFQVPPTMPKKISFDKFVNDILGFSVDDSVI